MPKRIMLQIGAMIYRVCWKHRPRFEGKFTVGVIDYYDQTIDTYAGLASPIEWVNLWHETLHAVLYNAGHTGKHDEELINTLAHGICQVLINNPIMHQPLEINQRTEPEDEAPTISLEEEMDDDNRRD